MADLSATMKDEFRRHRWISRPPKNLPAGYVLALSLCRQARSNHD